MKSKEKCLEAYETLKSALYVTTYDFERFPINCEPVYVEEMNVFKQLIDEHFDNPPLKFEELKVGMWVWDNKHKVYNCISRIYQNLYPNVNAIQFKHLNESTQWGDIIEFEENRFYRKQVQE